MRLKPVTKEAVSLFMDGIQAFSRAESAGLRIDVPYLDKTIADVTTKISWLQEDLKRDNIFKMWHRRFGDRTKLGSRDQLAVVLHKDLCYRWTDFTATGRLKADEESLEKIFKTVGDVLSTKIITDMYTGKSKGFGFVTLADDTQADKAIQEMNGKEIEGRAMVVNEARPMEENAPRRPRRDFGGGGGGERRSFNRRY